MHYFCNVLLSTLLSLQFKSFKTSLLNVFFWDQHICETDVFTEKNAAQWQYFMTSNWKRNEMSVC